MFPEVQIEYGIMPTGMYCGRYFDQIPDNYIIDMVRMLRQPDSRYPRKESILKYVGDLADKLVFQKEAAQPKNEYYGKVGDLVALLVTIKTIFWIKRNGVFVMSMEDFDGHSFTAFYKGDIKFKRGEICKITGIIRDHKEYRGTKQTGLSKIKKAIKLRSFFL